MTEYHIQEIIQSLFELHENIRYVAIYRNGELELKQKEQHPNSSSNETDKYEELFVNPTLLTITRQRGMLDCGGLKHVLVAYGNFIQMIKEIQGGHLSICLDQQTNICELPKEIVDFLNAKYPGFI